MDQISAPASRVQSPIQEQGQTLTRQEHHQTSHLDPHGPPDARDTRMDQVQSGCETTRHITAAAGAAAPETGNTGIAPHSAAEASASQSQDVTIPPSSISEPGLRKIPDSPDARPGSLATTAVSSPDRQRRPLPGLRPQCSGPHSLSFLAALAKFAAFTDAFLSGLIIPLVPSILETRAHVPYQQIQIWTSVLVSAYAGAFAVVSPLMPLLVRQGPTSFAVLLGGFACAVLAFSCLQLSCDLSVLILGRALHGLAAAAITGACSGLLATAVSSGSSSTWSPITPTFIQSVAMATAPTVAGFLHDRHDPDAVFYLAYAFIGLNIMISLVAVNKSPIAQSWPREEAEGLLEPGTQNRGYGTLSSHSRDLSGNSSRSVSPTAPPLSGRHSSLPAAVAWNTRLLIAMGGYLVVGLLTSALQSVLPLFVKRHYGWSVVAAGRTFIPLSAPGAFVGLLSGALAVRVPKSARFLAAIGFLACLPAFLYLGKLRENTPLVQHAFFLTLSGLSFAVGLPGDPLIKEITNTVGSSATDAWSATAHATSLPQLASAWGSLFGPLFAGGINWVCGWQAMSMSLAIVAGAAGVGSLLFLQGWIGQPYPELRTYSNDVGDDEESAPLLANDHAGRNPFGHLDADGSSKGGFHMPRQDSDGVSPHTRSGQHHKHRPHRRHFSVDNFSVASTAAPGSLDSSTSSIRFQAALETPVQGAPHLGAKRAQTSDSASKTSAERRYVMREAPHAPATDPLLAAGSLYVIDEERDTARGIESERQKRRVVVFAEGTAPPELLQRHRHHIVAINALDGTAQMVSNSTDNHAVHVTEETGEEEPDFHEETSRRYVVVVVEGEDEDEAH
ncbi:hypothetical protein VTI74DRAFT_8469 [Chaetomium olivicolor]